MRFHSVVPQRFRKAWWCGYNDAWDGKTTFDPPYTTQVYVSAYKWGFRDALADIKCTSCRKKDRQICTVLREAEEVYFVRRQWWERRR